MKRIARGRADHDIGSHCGEVCRQPRTSMGHKPHTHINQHHERNAESGLVGDDQQINHLALYININFLSGK
ncbi:hypothetical protein [Acidocella aminolytica]|uniref:hypothetical protein n=1 Tax=Acidocella aminolytica TaxID=33998 RepID=UPI0009352D8E|nr:hypothetical protein [Acidocella aminolytica]